MTELHDARVRCTVNGRPWCGRVDVRRSLLDLLRDEMGLRGTKRGCEAMSCGVCTVLVDGAPVSACGMFAVDADGADIRTVEGLGGPDRPDPLQRAFADRVAAQCGYCTSGQLMSATALLESQSNLSRAQIVEWMQTNLCRCGGYLAIVEAIEDAYAARPPD